MRCAPAAWRVLGQVAVHSIVRELPHSRTRHAVGTPLLGDPELAPWDTHKATSARGCSSHLLAPCGRSLGAAVPPQLEREARGCPAERPPAVAERKRFGPLWGRNLLKRRLSHGATAAGSAEPLRGRGEGLCPQLPSLGSEGTWGRTGLIRHLPGTRDQARSSLSADHPTDLCITAQLPPSPMCLVSLISPKTEEGRLLWSHLIAEKTEVQASNSARP